MSSNDKVFIPVPSLKWKDCDENGYPTFNDDVYVYSRNSVNLLLEKGWKFAEPGELSDDGRPILYYSPKGTPLSTNCVVYPNGRYRCYRKNLGRAGPVKRALTEKKSVKKVLSQRIRRLREDGFTNKRIEGMEAMLLSGEVSSMEMMWALEKLKDLAVDSDSMQAYQLYLKEVREVHKIVHGSKAEGRKQMQAAPAVTINIVKPQKQELIKLNPVIEMLENDQQKVIEDATTEHRTETDPETISSVRVPEGPADD